MKHTENSKTKSAFAAVVYIIVRVTLIATGIYSAFAGKYYTAFQCALTVMLFFLPALMNRHFSIRLPDALEILIILFIFGSVFLGEVRNFYVNVPYWDKMLHTLSGFISAAIGLSLVGILNRSERIKFMLSPFFGAFFAFCFAMTVGVLWEFFEYASDMLLFTDMQKDTLVTKFYSSELAEYGVIGINEVSVNGISLPGYLDIGIIDTMNDLIVASVGAAVFCAFGVIYLSSRGKKHLWINSLMMRRDAGKNEKNSDEKKNTDKNFNK